MEESESRWAAFTDAEVLDLTTGDVVGKLRQELMAEIEARGGWASVTERSRSVPQPAGEDA